MKAQVIESAKARLHYISKSDGDRRTKLVVEISPFELEEVPGKKAKYLHLTVRSPFDVSFPAERALVDAGLQFPQYDPQTGKGIFELVYSVKMDLEADRVLLAKELKQLYRAKKIGTILRSKRLRRLTKEQRNGILGPIARQGVSVFSRLFPRKNLRRGLVEVKYGQLFAEALRSVLSRPQLISIKSHVPLFPWAFLYDDLSFDKDDLSTVRPGRFWGFRHEIQQVVEGISPRTAIPRSFKVFTAIDPDVGGGSHKAKDHPLVRLGDGVTSAESTDELGIALRDFQQDVLYFFGHASDTTPPTDHTSWLKLQEVELTVYELREEYEAPHFARDPVVAILNGCRTSPLEAWDAQTVVGYLCENSGQSLCCVATVAEIPGAFASAFARHLLEDFLVKKHPLGSALLCARKVMLKEWRNPLGLLYSLFGSVDTQIKTDEEESHA